MVASEFLPSEASGSNTRRRVSTDKSNPSPSSTEASNPPRRGSDSKDQGQGSKPPRKINRTAPSLKRNAACLPCRRRRIKCDAGKPFCSSCSKTYLFLRRTHPDAERDAAGVPCEYEPEPDDDEVLLAAGTKRKAEEEKAKDDLIRDLQARVANLESNHGSSNQPGPSYYPTQTPLQSSAYPTFDIQFTPSDNSSFTNALPAQAYPNDPPPFQGAISSDEYTEGAQNGTGGGTLGEESGKVNDPMLDMFWPGWPPTLPVPAVVEHLVETFFSSVPCIPFIFNRQDFLFRLSLPPIHPLFPQRSLLHAICAVASRYSLAVKTLPIEDYINLEDYDARTMHGRGCWIEVRDMLCFSERNARHAVATMNYHHIGGRGLLDTCQALLVFNYWCQTTCRWMEGWMNIGAACRLATCLGLFSSLSYHHPPPHPHPPADPASPFPRPQTPVVQQSILGPPKTEAEREERLATAWMAFCQDSEAAVSSGWVNQLGVEELTIPFPASRADRWSEGPIPENVQTYHSTDINISHPVPDAFVLLIKGQILLSRVGVFIRRYRKLSMDEKETVRESSEFKEIEKDIQHIRSSWPAGLKDPVQYMNGYQKQIDADLISAHLLPPTAAILLHEPFADLSDPACPSARKLLHESKGCLKVVFEMCNNSAAISYSVSAIAPWFLYTAARTLLLFYRRALATSDLKKVVEYHNEIAAVRTTMAALSVRNAMAARYNTLLSMTIRALEEETIGHTVLNGDFSSSFPFTPFSSASNKGQAGESLGIIPAQDDSQPAAGLISNHPDGIFFKDHIQLRGMGRMRDVHPGVGGLAGVFGDGRVVVEEEARLEDVMDEKRGFLGGKRRRYSEAGGGSEYGRSSVSSVPGGPLSGKINTQPLPHNHPSFSPSSVSSNTMPTAVSVTAYPVPPAVGVADLSGAPMGGGGSAAGGVWSEQMGRDWTGR
ncbi:hypothetical protein I350_04483 [Cryptococcus amylolentus CBS 6273]|uniref:Zn(2)-C6 fungal-type domain-containing protein n=1 Tax=Cryptococcus amylolentus CBS 6273 TaxID=1296118 RepID=A0A1E3K1T0_9TREE|nr:hypothetical protein I350_04483 [Cryptococcus amylolentus CBS 6273]